MDGELPFEALSPDDQVRARHMSGILDHVQDFARTDSPGLAPRVMQGLPAGRPARRRSLLARLRGLLAPAGPAWRPAVATGLLGLAVGFGAGLWSGSDAAAPSVEVRAPGSQAGADFGTVYVRFDLRAPGASSVSLAGSFSDWEPRHDLTPSGQDHWSVTVPLDPGVHDYVYVVDGQQYVVDPAAPQVADGFGSFNNRIALLTSST